MAIGKNYEEILEICKDFDVNIIQKTCEYIDEYGVPKKRDSINHYLEFENGRKYPTKYFLEIANNIILRHKGSNKELKFDDFTPWVAEQVLEELIPAPMPFKIIAIDFKEIRQNIINRYKERGFVIEDLEQYTAIKKISGRHRNNTLSEIEIIGKSRSFSIRVKYDLLDVELQNQCEKLPDTHRWTHDGSYRIDSPQSEEMAYRIIDNIIEKSEEGHSESKQNSNDIEPKNGNKPMTQPLNQILYGPPGTGKTYNTVVKAIDVIGYEYLFKKWFLQTSKAKDKDGTLKQYLSCIYKFKENIGINIFLCKEKDIYEKLKTCIENTQYFKENCLHADSSPGLSHYQQALLHYKSFLNDSNFSYEEIKECFYYYKTIKQPLIEFITFHQSYSYEEFVEGIKPHIPKDIWEKSDEELKNEKLPDVKYIGKKGIFKDICDRARKDKDNNYVLIIDEINRGNISKIFGELITLIEEDKRENVTGDKDKEYNTIKVRLPYSGDEFSVPNNLYIIGTMNTADRSIALLDTALRRRFDFEEMMPDLSLLDGKSVELDGGNIDLQKLLEKLNKNICEKGDLDKNHQIGHAYLINVDDEKKLRRAFLNKIYPLLEEYFYDEEDKIKKVLDYTDDLSNIFEPNNKTWENIVIGLAKL